MRIVGNEATEERCSPTRGDIKGIIACDLCASVLFEVLNVAVEDEAERLSRVEAEVVQIRNELLRLVNSFLGLSLADAGEAAGSWRNYVF